MLKTPKTSSKNVIGAIKQCRNKEYILGNKSKANLLMNQGVYVLQVGMDKYYVGKSNNIILRIEQHASGHGSNFVKEIVQRLSPCVEYIHDWESWERAETLHWMYTRGISNVRGWMYTDPVLSVDQKRHAFAQICEKYDLCRKCGQSGHFVTECVNKGTTPKPFWFK